jgi:hypothetical protein
VRGTAQKTIIRVKLANESQEPLSESATRRFFAILLKLAAHPAHVLKGPVAEKRMIAALIQLAGVPLPALRIASASAGPTCRFGILEKRRFAFPHGGRNDGD